MAMIINEEQMVNQNIFNFEDRLNSPVVRLLDQTPTFVTYYHVNVNESTSDEGFHDAESIIGSRSPLRYQKVEKFPIYGLDQIILQLQDTEAGLDTSYEGEATILPNTIKPLPNDFFVISYLDGNYIFRVLEINFDTIRSDNFYKIRFCIEYNDENKLNDLNELVHDKYTCVLENIGTENKCIIQHDYKEKLDQIDTMYSDMVSLYLSLFYNEKHNVVLGELPDGRTLYDPYMTEFINVHGLVNRKSSLSTILLENQIVDSKFKLKYERSLWRMVERRDARQMKPCFYITYQGIAKKESTFYRWKDPSIMVLDIPAELIPEQSERIFSDLFVETVRCNGPVTTSYASLFKKFIRDEDISIYDIPLNMNDELMRLDANLEMFFMTPVLLYIIKETIRNFLKNGIAEEPS